MFVAIGELVSSGELIVARGVPRQRTDVDAEVAVVTPTELSSAAPFDRFASMADVADTSTPLCQPGDVLTTIDGGQIGASYLVRRPFNRSVAPSQGSALMRIPDGGPLLPGFLYAWLAGPAFQEEASRRTTGVSMRHLAWRELLAIEIPVPSSDEQARVATTIERYLDVLDAQHRVLEVASNLLATDLEILSAQLASSKGDSKAMPQ